MLLKREFVDSTRGRIVAFLRGGSRTVDEIAAHLRVTKSAVRAQMAAMERDGVVRRAGLRAGTTRPFRVFELTAEAEQLLSKGYVPVVTHLLDVLADTFSSDELDDLLETAGRRLARSLTPARAYPRRRSARALVVSEMLNEHLGALTRVLRNGELTIRGRRCPLAALTGKHPAVCRLMEVVVSELMAVPVRECCDRTESPACCFVIAPAAGRDV